MYLLIGGHFQHHGAQFHPHAGCAQHLDIAPGVFRAGKLLAKPMQAKPVVDALVQNTAQLCIAFQNQNIAQAMLPRAVRRRQARRAAAIAAQTPAGPPPMITSSTMVAPPSGFGFTQQHIGTGFVLQYIQWVNA